MKKHIHHQRNNYFHRFFSMERNLKVYKNASFHMSCASSIDNLTLRASLGEQNAKYPRRKCRSPHATNCTLSKKCATSCAKKFNSAWTRPVSRLEMRSCYRPRIIYMQHVGRVHDSVSPRVKLQVTLFLLFHRLFKRFAHETAFESHYSTKSRARV